MKILNWLFYLLVLCTTVNAQNNSVGIGIANPHASSILDISSSNKGVLLPRMSSAQRKAIPAPAAGLMVFDLDKATVFLFDGNDWQPMMFSTGGAAIPPVLRTPNDGQANDIFGGSVDISGNYAIVGAYQASNTVSQQGCAYIFYRNNGVWTQQAKLVASDPAFDDSFGGSVSISGDYAVVGAFLDDINSGPPFFINYENRGSAYVFVRNGSTWTQQAKITSTIGASNLGFGISVAIDGDYIAAGAYAEGDGVVYVFQRSGTSWLFQQKLTVINSVANEAFGVSVDIKGAYLIAGANWEQINTNNQQGAAYIFNRVGTNWTQQARLFYSGGNASDQFGSSVAISDNYAVVGAYLFDQNTILNRGIVHVYTRNGSTWGNASILNAGDLEADDQFGKSVSIADDYIVVGSWKDANSFPDEGSAYLFKREAAGWKLQRKINDPNPLSNGQFGNTVAIDGFNIVIGAMFKLSTGAIAFLNIE